MGNSRFKFRIWDKFCETWLTDFAINQDGEINKFFNSKEALKRRFVLMQCTGLKDKNGKLIYEGDIIQIPDDYDTYGMFACEKREIYFNEGGFRLKPKLDKNSRGNWLEDTKDFEVIGNIYENKKLLEE